MLLPESLAEELQRNLQRFNEVAPEETRNWLNQAIEQDSNFRSQLKRVWSCSDFVVASCCSYPALLQQLVESGDLARQYSEGQMQAQLKTSILATTDDAGAMQQLRLFRQREMVRIIWRDFTRSATLEETTRDMTWLAETVIQQSLDVIYSKACLDWGTPVNDQGEPQQLVVLGMGKLGAWELNVSSDIDLIFAYPEKGETVGGKRQLDNQKFFVKLCQKLIKFIDERTVDGFVFRVDMRLRPYGQSGALVLNFDALEEYYQSQGRDWERYAMIKARVVAGDTQVGKQLITMLRPFTYRKYIDYSAIQALREMKALINREVKRSGSADDIKKSAGGIREVEFIVQAFQIIRGGRDKRFQQQPLRKILPLLEDQQLLPEGAAEKLYKAYTFLRNTEHALQGWRDQQTQRLPGDDQGKLRVAWLMGFDSWDSFAVQLEHYRSQVREIFSGVVAEPEEADSAAVEDKHGVQVSTLIWQESVEGVEAERELLRLGYSEPGETLSRLAQLRESRAVISMTAAVRSRLDAFIPLLLDASAQAESPVRALLRIMPLVESVVRRSAYLVMLIENPAALERLVRLCDASPWIANELARHPALLDELLDSRTLFSPPDKSELQNELRQQLLRIPNEDLEAQMDALRYFRMAHGLRVAACEITDVLPLMKVSDYLTWLAEAILEQVLAIAWDQMVERYGRPCGRNTEPGMVVIGYGKMGGIELGHGSDLDLVFLHNAEQGMSTNGERAVDNNTFFTRLGQRVIHMLTAQTAAGTVYEVDMRLRPSGNSGLLVSSMQAFEKYQQQEAWTWEHQALVRARPVAGNDMLAKDFSRVRHEVLSQAREKGALQADVVKMRQKMYQHLNKGTVGETGVFDLKQGRGGIVDIEFMVQFAVLAWSHDYPELTRWSDNIRILESLEECELLSADEVHMLTEAYKKYRATGHRLQLQQQSSIVNAEEFNEMRRDVETLWRRYLNAY